MFLTARQTFCFAYCLFRLLGSCRSLFLLIISLIQLNCLVLLPHVFLLLSLLLSRHGKRWINIAWLLTLLLSFSFINFGCLVLLIVHKTKITKNFKTPVSYFCFKHLLYVLCSTFIKMSHKCVKIFLLKLKSWGSTLLVLYHIKTRI